MLMPSAFHWQKIEINILGDFYDIVSSAGTPTTWPNTVVLNPSYCIFFLTPQVILMRTLG